MALKQVQASAQESQSPSRSLCPQPEGDVPSHFSPHSLPDAIYTVQTFSKEPINESLSLKTHRPMCLTINAYCLRSWRFCDEERHRMIMEQCMDVASSLSRLLIIKQVREGPHLKTLREVIVSTWVLLKCHETPAAWKWSLSEWV